MNALDLLLQKEREKGEQLTTLERLILRSGDPNVKLQAATELATKNNALTAFGDLLEGARAAGKKTVDLPELEAIASSLEDGKARARDFSRMKS